MWVEACTGILLDLYKNDDRVSIIVPLNHIPPFLLTLTPFTLSFPHSRLSLTSSFPPSSTRSVPPGWQSVRIVQYATRQCTPWRD